jgi:hypothetical protein
MPWSIGHPGGGDERRIPARRAYLGAMTARRPATPAIVAALALAGCGEGDEPTTPTAATPPPSTQPPAGGEGGAAAVADDLAPLVERAAGPEAAQAVRDAARAIDGAGVDSQEARDALDRARAELDRAIEDAGPGTRLLLEQLRGRLDELAAG